jgi:hypothetical protein
MSSKYFKLGSIIGFSAILFTASAVQAADNPLDPLYYANKVTIAATAPGANSTAYRDSGNPLHPSFGRLNMTNWQAVAATGGMRYLDSNNPLHPSYRRI